MTNYKQVILVREDLKLSKGKMAAQVAHASVEALLNSHKDYIEEWRGQGMKKSILKVQDEKELIEYKKKADKKGLVAAIIRDAGHTEIPQGTITCLGIGPDKEEKIDEVTGKLKLI